MKHSRKNRKPNLIRVIKIISIALMFITVIVINQKVVVMENTQKGERVNVGLTAENQKASTSSNVGNRPWNLILINKQNPIPEDYSIELVKIFGGEKVDKRIYKSLMEMLEDAKEANWGKLPKVISGYRTQEKQQQLFDDKVERYKEKGYDDDEAIAKTEKWVARPGYSEHGIGIAVDISGKTYNLFTWLRENSYKYGFILRYPGNKTNITGTEEEAWHYRYVGFKAAKEIFEKGICLEEYLQK